MVEKIGACRAYLRKSAFGQLRHYCGKKATHAVFAGESIQGFGCESHARRLAQSYRHCGGTVRPIQGVPERCTVDGNVTYREA